MAGKKIIITIDGWSSCGKSTLAKQLAGETEVYLYRQRRHVPGHHLYFLRNHVDWTEAAGSRKSFEGNHIEFIHQRNNPSQRNYAERGKCGIPDPGSGGG